MVIGDVEMRERRERLRRGPRVLPSRPQPIPTRGADTGLRPHAHLGQLDPLLVPAAGDIKAQSVRLADVFVFGPMMLFAGLGKQTPKWVRVGMVIIGAGTIVYNLVNYMTIEREAREAGLGQMAWGPHHKATDLHRPINLLHQIRPR